jgi:hypothetical protein
VHQKDDRIRDSQIAENQLGIDWKHSGIAHPVILFLSAMIPALFDDEMGGTAAGNGRLKAAPEKSTLSGLHS